MNAAISDFQTMGSDMFLMIAQEWGALMTYSSRGTTAIPVYGIISRGSSKMVKTLGSRVRETTNIFWIGKQGSGTTLFPPAVGIMEDDTITDDAGITYSIREDDPDDVNSVFKFISVNTIAKTSGQS